MEKLLLIRICSFIAYTCSMYALKEKIAERYFRREKISQVGRHVADISPYGEVVNDWFVAQLMDDLPAMPRYIDYIRPMNLCDRCDVC